MQLITTNAGPATTTEASAVELSEVSFGFTAARDALHAISITVPVGSTFAVLGPNGAGKSTLLELIAGLRTPRRGTLRVGHVQVTGSPSSRPDGVMLMSPRAVPPAGFTVASLLRHVAAWHARWDAETASALLQRFALAGQQRIDTLSFGGQMKVQLITALASQPRVLLLDEPFLGLDIRTKEALIDGMLSVDTTQPRTTLIASHDLAELELLVDHVVVLNEGRVHLTGNLDDLRIHAGAAATLRDLSRPTMPHCPSALELAV
ncbi:MAG: ABC transporter ATP-binding protein [Gemmatimonadota bacterium]